MIKIFLYTTLLFGFTVNGQQIQKIQFEYDQAGNQVKRSFCLPCAAKSDYSNYKEVAELKNNDFEKFFENDVISYYPNPVKEFLQLKWELIDDNRVKSIYLHTLNGQLQKEINSLENTLSQSISFQNLPNGMYILILLYTNGDEKTIKIIK